MVVTLSWNDIESTKDIPIPKDPLARVIGQDEAVELARIIAMQHRHLLLVGPPGTGKSMIAQALSLHLPKPTEEIRVVHNPENPERPLIECKKSDEVYKERASKEFADGEILEPDEVPHNAAVRLGYKCSKCSTFSSPKELACPKCGEIKTPQTQFSTGPLGDIFKSLEVTISQIGVGSVGTDRVTTTESKDGKEEVIIYERAGSKIKRLDQKALEKRREIEKRGPYKVLVALERKPFVLATGASETELLGDVRHDPYGGHPHLGAQPYERVIPGAIHEAHEGVLFIDELPHLANLQRYILTAMQEKKFPISGRNPQSAGASVKVDNVPCDFVFVGACNIQDLPAILSPLRSRITGDGYEILVQTTMKDTEENRLKIAQFVAQEIWMDQRIPPASKNGILAVIHEAKRRAKIIDGKSNALTLRLRELGGVIRAAGDLALITRSEFIEEKHIRVALEKCKSAEEQIKDRYGSYYRGISADITPAQKASANQYYWSEYALDDKSGYV
jgi:ATP-dependent Lon protease